MRKGLIVAGVIALVMLVAGFSIYGRANDIRDTAISMEQQLSKDYEDNQNFLSNYVSTIYEMAGIADKKSDKLDTILKDAVSGRYGEDGFKPNGAMFSAIQESYPDLTKNLDIYDKIADQVAAGREAYRGRQSKLLDETRAYRTFLQQGIMKHMVIAWIGFPSNELKARVGGKVLAEGPAALDKIEQIVVTNSTVNAYNSGRMDPISLK